MSDEQFTAFCVLLAAISLPSVSLMFALAWDLWQCGTVAERRRTHRSRKGLNND